MALPVVSPLPSTPRGARPASSSGAELSQSSPHRWPERGPWPRGRSHKADTGAGFQVGERLKSGSSPDFSSSRQLLVGGQQEHVCRRFSWESPRRTIPCQNGRSVGACFGWRSWLWAALLLQPAQGRLAMPSSPRQLDRLTSAQTGYPLKIPPSSAPCSPGAAARSRAT